MELLGYPLWAIALICIGVFIASCVDAIGGGGGIISVPIYLFAGLPAHLALGTNKMSACIGTAASTWRYIKNGFVDWSLALPAIALALVGSYFGTRLQLMADENFLRYFLLLILPIVAFVILKQKKLPEQRVDMKLSRRLCIIMAASLVVGVYDGFYGPGTGTFLLLIFCGPAKLDVRTASGNVKLINLASNIGSLITSLLAGKVLVPLGLLAAVFSIAGHYIGAGFTIKNGTKIVRPVIILVLLLLAVKTLLELL